MTLLKLMVVTHTCNFTLPFISLHTCSSIVRGEVGRGKGEGGRAENGKVEWSEGERGQRRRSGGGGEGGGLGVGESYSSSDAVHVLC